MTSESKRIASPSALRGQIEVPSDKSLVHRAVLFASIAEGLSRVRAKTMGRDNLATIRVMQQLGVEIACRLSADVYALAKEEGIRNISILDVADAQSNVCELEIRGKGLSGLRAPTEVLNCGNSGTTSRLLLGVLAAAQVPATIDGDASLRRRPFRRVTGPLSEMGAQFSSDTLPITITKGVSRGILYTSPKASAQVKSAILLAGLGVPSSASESGVVVSEPVLSRDHTERLFGLMGCPVGSSRVASGAWEASLPVDPQARRLCGSELAICGDFSAAAFLLAAIA